MAKRVSLCEGWDFLTTLKWQAKLFAYDAQYGVSDGYLTVKEAEKAHKEFHEIMDKWIPKVEAEICLAEIEMDNAPDIKEYESILNGNVFRTSKRAQRRKQNIHHHKADRKHGKHRELSRKEQDLVHYDATKGVHGAGVWYSSRGKKVVPVVSKGKKTNRNYYAKKYSQSADYKEKEFLEEMYTGRGDLLHENANFEEELCRYYEAIREMKEEQKWGYLTDFGEEYLEECEERTLRLEYWIKENMIQYNTAIR